MRRHAHLTTILPSLSLASVFQAAAGRAWTRTRPLTRAYHPTSLRTVRSHSSGVCAAYGDHDVGDGNGKPSSSTTLCVLPCFAPPFRLTSLYVERHIVHRPPSLAQPDYASICLVLHLPCIWLRRNPRTWRTMWRTIASLLAMIPRCPATRDDTLPYLLTFVPHPLTTMHPPTGHVQATLRTKVIRHGRRCRILSPKRTTSRRSSQEGTPGPTSPSLTSHLN